MNRLFRKCTAVIIIFMMILNLIACGSAEDPSGKAENVYATVIEIEKYGHAVLDITTAEFTATGYEPGDVVNVKFNSYESDMPFFDGYYTNPGVAMLRGISPEKNIAICINYGDLAGETGIAVGDSVEISMAVKYGMRTFQELCALRYSNDREDYPDDLTFANFREVTLGEIGKGKLYRSASPINNKNGRAAYADELIKAVNISTVVNLADSEEDIEEYLQAEDFNSGYYRDLYNKGKVTALDMTANFFSDSFAKTVADGLRFIIANDPPYCVHCTEGKDRSGFTVMIIASIMGAELDDIIDDYMLSFYNYYGIDKKTQPERYKVVSDNNLIAMLCHVTGADSQEELKDTDLQSAVTDYLLRAGMTGDEIKALQKKLR